MATPQLHWYRTESHASPLGHEFRAEYRGRTWRMYRLADGSWKVVPTDRPQQTKTFWKPEEARKWAAQAAMTNPGRKRNPQETHMAKKPKKNPDQRYRARLDDGSFPLQRFTKAVDARRWIRESGQGGQVMHMVAGKWLALGKPISAAKNPEYPNKTGPFFPIKATIYESEARPSSDAIFDAWTAGDLWNGAITPYFEKRQADRVLAYHKRDAEGGQAPSKAYYDRGRDAYVIEWQDDPQQTDVWAAEWIETPKGRKKVYPIGAYAYTWQELDEDAEANPGKRRRKNLTRKKNGAGLGALIGSTIGAVAGFGAGSIPLAALGSLAGGTVGGYFGAPKDRKKRGAAGGAIGGALLGPVGAGVGGWIGGKRADADYGGRRRNPSKPTRQRNPPLRRPKGGDPRRTFYIVEHSDGRWTVHEDSPSSNALLVKTSYEAAEQALIDAEGGHITVEIIGRNPSCGCSHREAAISRRVSRI